MGTFSPKSASQLSCSTEKIRILQDPVETKTYFMLEDGNDKFMQIIVRFGNKIAQFFGAKTISQTNLTNCVEYAHVSLDNEENLPNNSEKHLSIDDLLNAKAVIEEIRDFDGFARYLNTTKGNHCKIGRAIY